MMRNLLLKSAAAVVAATLSTSAYAQAQQQGQQQPGQAAQKLSEVYEREQAEAQRQGSRPVEVREQALWGLSDIAKERMHDAMKNLVQEPDKAYKDIMLTANVLELQASLGKSRDQQRGGQRQGVTPQGEQGQQQQAQQQGGSKADKLLRQAEQLRDLAKHVEYKLVLTKDDLKQPFAEASLALADFYQEAAQAGVGKADEEQTGYTLRNAAEYFQIAHTFAERRPSVEASKAIFDADRLGSQIVKLSKATTGQKQNENQSAKADGQSGDRQQKQGEGDLKEQEARVAGARVGGEQAGQLQEARRVVEQLGKAIEQTRTNLGGQQQGGEGGAAAPYIPGVPGHDPKVANPADQQAKPKQNQ